MRSISAPGIALCLSLACPGQPVWSAEPQAAPKVLPPVVVDLNTPREFPSVDTREAWQARAADIREQVLVSCGLWPMPEKTPLEPQIFGRIEREGYSVEKVYIQPLPGFYLAGNLYRPLGRGKGPFPGVLNPHGHWKEGRLTDNAEGSIAARCINFARQGMVAFCYDMVGYNDTFFADQEDVPADKFPGRHRHFATDPTNLLWNITLMGLQTWDSIRALDFLASLPDVDASRLACTGASGGGTQTFMLGAVEDRLAAQAPVVMVSHSMQGGCLCENAPGLRVKFSNMEIAAAAAPRPQILVASTKDWTKDTMSVEGPAIEHIYELFHAQDQFRYVQFDFGHNYNQTSREAVYDWFGKWLLKNPRPGTAKEDHYVKEPDADLRVFPNGKLPDDAITESGLIRLLKEGHESVWDALRVQRPRDLARFKRVMEPAWRHTLVIQWPKSTVRCKAEDVRQVGEYTTAALKINRGNEPETVEARYWAPPGIQEKTAPKVVVICTDQAHAAPLNAGDKPPSLPAALLRRGLAVLIVDQYSTGTPTNQFNNFYSTYNRTKLQERVRDILTVCTAANSGADPHGPRFFNVILWGIGQAGLWSLLAAPAARAVVADCNQAATTRDETLLAPDLFCPGIRNIGTFEGAAILAAPHPLLLHNTGMDFPTESLRSAYRGVGESDKVRVVAARLPDEDLLNWVFSALP